MNGCCTSVLIRHFLQPPQRLLLASGQSSGSVVNINAAHASEALAGELSLVKAMVEMSWELKGKSIRWIFTARPLASSRGLQKLRNTTMQPEIVSTYRLPSSSRSVCNSAAQQKGCDEVPWSPIPLPARAFLPLVLSHLWTILHQRCSLFLSCEKVPAWQHLIKWRFTLGPSEEQSFSL